ncbi:cell surface protein [Ahniella affigens]|uniref:Cell surface protein n=1 Tax=Ahniella affigens TaxID=2021234 RepID=A0A2P1PRE1_9GAMM|nr:cell surface protein [Ahniella affigens]AVP97394.1 cell surface protein [Ahniella affigens]
MSSVASAFAPLARLDKALGALRDLGLIKSQPEEAPVVALINKISHLDQDKSLAIARTLSQATLFNEVVREQITEMGIGERYKAITTAFDSIRDDAKAMVLQVEDGKIDTMERLSNIWMKITRGDIPSRFERIKDTYLEVAKESKDQITREQTILDAYRDFRGALKESQVLGLQLLKKAEEILSQARLELQSAADAVKAQELNEDRELVARLELARDDKLRQLQDEDKRYQIAKDLAENLSISYNTTEVIMARLMQITNAKERVYSQAVTFFGTNETVFTALSASFTGMHGLNESTQTLEAMKAGMNKSLETLGEVGTKVLEEATRAGYGPTLKADSVKKLVDAVVNFQEKSVTIIDEMRQLSSTNEREIQAAVEDGKRRLVALSQTANALPGPK